MGPNLTQAEGFGLGVGAKMTRSSKNKRLDPIGQAFFIRFVICRSNLRR